MASIPLVGKVSSSHQNRESRLNGPAISVLESTLRTANNLLERLHASFFFYLLTNADYSLKIGNFLPSAILVSVAMMFGGLRLWTDAGWIRLSEEKGAARWVTRPRPVLQVLTIMTSTHLVGAAMFWTINTSWVANSAVSILKSSRLKTDDLCSPVVCSLLFVHLRYHFLRYWPLYRGKTRPQYQVFSSLSTCASRQPLYQRLPY